MVAIKKPDDDVLFAGFIVNNTHKKLTVFQMFCVENYDIAFARCRTVFETTKSLVVHEQKDGIFEVTHIEPNWSIFLVPLELHPVAFHCWVRSFEDPKFIIENEYMVPAYMTLMAFSNFIRYVRWFPTFQPYLSTARDIALVRNELQNA